MKKFVSALKALPILSMPFACSSCASTNAGYDCSFIAIADAQYSSQSEPKMNRHYRLSIQKLEYILESEKSGNFDFTINLGDTIDGGFSDLKNILPTFERFPRPLCNLLGNHDLACNKEEQLQTVELLFKGGATYYSIDKGKWKFVFLDPMRLSGISKIKNEKCEREYKSLFSKLSAEKAVNAKPWNGGIDSEQLQWLDTQLKTAQAESKKAIVFCHMPIYPLNSESLYNWREVAELLAKRECVKAYIAGHNHKGGYACSDGIHYITVNGLVEGKKISYARVFLSENLIRVAGVGDAKSLELIQR